MSKSDVTLELERMIWGFTRKTGVFGCFEVTIGIHGNQRVDYLTVDTKNIWRAYEIKSSKEDFYSKARWSFVGHYNYFVMLDNVYEEVKQDIPEGIGVITLSGVIKKPKKKRSHQHDKLMMSFMRSTYRDAEKWRKAISRGVTPETYALQEKIAEQKHTISSLRYQLKKHKRSR